MKEVYLIMGIDAFTQEGAILKRVPERLVGHLIMRIRHYGSQKARDLLFRSCTQFVIYGILLPKS